MFIFVLYHASIILRLGKNLAKEANKVNCDEAPQDGGSVAYISETLIKQVTKEDKLDMITSLTINFPKDKLNKKIKVFHIYKALVLFGGHPYNGDATLAYEALYVVQINLHNLRAQFSCNAECTFYKGRCILISSCTNCKSNIVNRKLKIKNYKSKMISPKSPIAN
jgi:hypothetical protein